MQNNKIFIFIIGTRAQLIKVAPVILECEARRLKCTLIMTGQHLETMQDLLDEFGVKSEKISALPAKERSTVLSLFKWLPQAYSGVVKQLKNIKSANNNVHVLVHGDTLSTVLGAIAGRRVGARVVHLESGLTSNKIFDPFPEEIARRVVFRLSHIAMCPSEETLKHMQEKHPKCEVVNTKGNTILDAIRLSGIVRHKDVKKASYIVVSLHRFQNIYDRKRLLKLIGVLQGVAMDHQVKFVLHPATQRRLHKYGLYDKLKNTSNIELIPRLGYSTFLKLAAESECVLTDGGSNQEELAAIGVPTIIMREATERSDGLKRNALMEAEVPGSIIEYISQGTYKKLEVESIGNELRPSKLMVDYLCK